MVGVAGNFYIRSKDKIQNRFKKKNNVYLLN